MGVEEQQGDSFRESRMEVQTQRTVDNSGITINKCHQLGGERSREQAQQCSCGVPGGSRGTATH